jgi:hypothetical protein
MSCQSYPPWRDGLTIIGKELNCGTLFPLDFVLSAYLLLKRAQFVVFCPWVHAHISGRIAAQPISLSVTLKPAFVCLAKILSLVWVTMDGVWIGDWFIIHLQIETTSNYNTVANLHTLQITTAHPKPSQSDFTSRFPVTDLNNGDSSACVLTSLLFGEYPTTLIACCLTPRLAAISRQPPSFLFTDWLNNWLCYNTDELKSQSYFTTDGLPPISSSWPKTSILFFNWTLAVIVFM